MTHQSPPSRALPGGDPGRQVASLREALVLVRSLCGEDPASGGDELLDEAAWFSSAYEQASPVAKRRFDAMAGEMADWAAAGVEALLAAGEGPPPAPARRLAVNLEDGLTRLRLLLDR
jgi:hypothetical protein